jgi:hypothetical protein
LDPDKGRMQPGSASAGPPASPGSTTPVVLFYYRPLEGQHHGETQYVRNLVNRLAEVTAPTLVAPSPTGGTHGTNAYVTMIRNVILTNLAQARFLLGKRSRTDHAALVVVDAYSALLPLVWSRLRRLPTVYVASDPPEQYAESLRASRIPGGLLLKVLRLPIERRLLRQADLVVCRSSWMASELARSGCAESRLRVLRHPPQVEPPDVEEIARIQSATGLAGRVGVVFLGDFEYPPNVEGLSFVLDRVVPVLHRDAANVRLLLVGPGSERWAQSGNPEVIALGAVPRLSQVLYASAIGIAPSVVSGGTSAKTIDYLAHGLTCLVTPTVAQSFEADPRIVVAPREGFASALVSLIRSTPVPRATPDYFRERLGTLRQTGNSSESSAALVREISKLGSSVHP